MVRDGSGVKVVDGQRVSRAFGWTVPCSVFSGIEEKPMVHAPDLAGEGMPVWRTEHHCALTSDYVVERGYYKCGIVRPTK